MSKFVPVSCFGEFRGAGNLCLWNHSLLCSFIGKYSLLFYFCSKEIGKTKFNSMIGLVDRERVDEELYDDYESAKARKVWEYADL